MAGRGAAVWAALGAQDFLRRGRRAALGHAGKGGHLRPALSGRFLVFGSRRLSGVRGELAAGIGNVSDAGLAGGALEDWRPCYNAGVPWHRDGYGERRAAPAGRAATTAGKAHGGAAFAFVFASVDETRAFVAHWLATSRFVDYSPGSFVRKATDRALSRAQKRNRRRIL